MTFSHPGEAAACITAVAWTITSVSFEIASKRIGTLPVNILRLFGALILLTIFGFFFRGKALPSDANAHQFIWLSVSGIVGFVLGDLFLFRAFVLIGARVSMLIMCLAPFIAACCAFAFLGETVSRLGISGMLITLTGVALVVFKRDSNNAKISGIRLSFPKKGILYALLGAVGQGMGIVLSKYGMDGFDPFASTQIRIFAGTIGFAAVITVMQRWNHVKQGIHDKRAVAALSVGTFFGPFIGVSFSLVAVTYTSAGIASTIMSIVPVLLIIPSRILFKEKITAKGIIGAVLSFAGVALFFL
jgi:drug/metabolite transporter (DMT)-like permease